MTGLSTSSIPHATESSAERWREMEWMDKRQARQVLEKH